MSPSVSPSPSASASASASASESPSVSPSPSPSPGIPEKDYTREANGTLPTNTNDLSTIYTTLEENKVFANDNVYVDLTGVTGAYLMHLFKKTNDNREDNFDIRAVVKSSYAPSTKPVYLQIWNGTTLSWETIASNNSADANEKFSLDAFVTTNDSNYYDFGNQVAVRVYQQNDSGSGKTLSIDQFKLSFVAQYSPTFSSPETQYSEVFPTVNTNEYTPKYPSKNPQDDL